NTIKLSVCGRQEKNIFIGLSLNANESRKNERNTPRMPSGFRKSTSKNWPPSAANKSVGSIKASSDPQLSGRGSARRQSRRESTRSLPVRGKRKNAGKMR